MVEIKAIETIYLGYHFRSRLEARWAVFLTTCGLKFDYEPQGFEFDGFRYLPDFWVHPQLDDDGHERIPGFWIEVKGVDVHRLSRDWKKVSGLALSCGDDVYLFTGEIGPGQHGLRLRAYEDDEGVDRVGEQEVAWHQCPHCQSIEPVENADRMSCACVSIFSQRGLIEDAQLAARQARFERGRRGG